MNSRYFDLLKEIFQLTGDELMSNVKIINDVIVFPNGDTIPIYPKKMDAQKNNITIDFGQLG